MLCAKCNYYNPANAMFCMQCGTKVENRCPSCNTLNPADCRFSKLDPARILSQIQTASHSLRGLFQRTAAAAQTRF